MVGDVGLNGVMVVSWFEIWGYFVDDGVDELYFF